MFFDSFTEKLRIAIKHENELSFGFLLEISFHCVSFISAQFSE